MDDTLFTTRNAFYAGDFNSVIHTLEGGISSSANEEEVLYLLARSKIAVGNSSGALELLTQRGGNPGLIESLKILASISSVSSKSLDASERENAVSQIISLQAGGSKNGRFLLVCGLALLKLDAMESAFKVLTQHQGDNLEW